ncbi:MAG: fumarylacetoacetate hydrolase family protein [Pseudomonadota bacterium]
MDTQSYLARLNGLPRDLEAARLYGHALDWPSELPADVPEAYAAALAVRAARLRAGDVPVGYKVGFTNQSIWPLYAVDRPIWGTMWKSGLALLEEGEGDEGLVSLAGLSEPRIEPEIVFGLNRAVPPGCTLDQLVRCIGWMAHGFEIVHTHFPGWKFTAAQTVADAGLHARLLVGHRVEIPEGVAAQQVVEALGQVQLRLFANGVAKDEGSGSQVLGGPVQALLHFVRELAVTAGAPTLKAGDLITTGTLTDAHAVAPGEVWHTELLSDDALVGELRGLRVRFS